MSKKSVQKPERPKLPRVYPPPGKRGMEMAQEQVDA
jgi:hypothetical protein